MDRLRLTRSVSVFGTDLFGRQSKVVFTPTESWGWFWRTGEKDLAITSSLVLRKARRISLQNGTKRLEIYEHIGCLRWTGLDAMLVESNSSPPYFGRASEFWRQLRPFVRPTGRKVPWLTISQPLKVMHKENENICLEMRPCIDGQPQLKATIVVDYPGLGRKEFVWQSLGHELDKIFNSSTLGWPPWLYYLSCYAPTFLWQHHRRIAWPQQFSKADILTHIVRHRLADLLGVLSLFSHQGLLAGEIISHCAGHEADVELVKRIRPLLCPL